MRSRAGFWAAASLLMLGAVATMGGDCDLDVDVNRDNVRINLDDDDDFFDAFEDLFD